MKRNVASRGARGAFEGRISAPPPARAQSSLAALLTSEEKKPGRSRAPSPPERRNASPPRHDPRPAVRFGRQILPRSFARRAERRAGREATGAGDPPSRLTRWMLLRRSGSARKADGNPAPRALESAAACEDAISSLSVSHEPYWSAVALDARVCVQTRERYANALQRAEIFDQKRAKYLRRGAKKGTKKRRFRL